MKLRATFDNNELLLFPGQFVNVSLVVTTLKNQTIIPAAAVRRGAPDGVQSAFVYLVNPNNTVSVRPVVLGVVDGENQSVRSGLDVNDVVVTDGGDRLREGAQVELPDATARKSPRPAPGAGRTQEPAALPLWQESARVASTGRPGGYGGGRPPGGG